MSTEPSAVRDESGRRRAVITLAACLGLAGVGALLIVLIFNTEPTAQREGAVRQSASLVDVTRPEAGSFRPTIEAMGTVRPAREITLAARVEGQIVDMADAFVPGGFIEAGQRLLKIDEADYRVALQQAEGALEQAIAELEIERGERAAAEAEYRQFDRELPPERRALVLREPQGRAARARVEAARADLRAAELDLERTRVEAPFDAHVVSRAVNLGSQVSPGASLGRLVGVDRYWIEATVPVSRLPWIDVPEGDEPGARVRVRNRNAWPEGVHREGEVLRVIGELEGETRLARILVEVDDPLARDVSGDKPRLMLGEYVTSQIQGRELSDVVRIEREYVRENDTVWLMVDGRLVIRSVSIVFQDGAYAYIDAGLSGDDRVVTTRLATVKEGLRLRVEDERTGDGGDATQ